MLRLKNKSAVIFGGSGFVGHHLASRLLDEGVFVTVADIAKPSKMDKRIKFVKINIKKEGSLKKILQNKDYAFNLAAALPFKEDYDDYLKESIEVNVKGAVNIAKACKEAGVKKLVFASGYVVYGVPRYLPLDEKHPTEPEDIYGVSKLAAEKYLQVLAQMPPPLNLVLLRMASIYGPGQTSRGLIPNLFRASLNNIAVTIFAQGKERRDYIFIDDAISVLILSLKQGVNGVFNIGSGESVSARRIKEIIEGLAGRKIKACHNRAKGKIPDIVLSVARAKKYLGYKPKVSIKAGLALSYKWYKEHYLKQN